MRNLLEISKSGLRSAERSLSVTANNLINADTPGYTRQRVDKTPNGMQMTGYSAGLGVNISNVHRLRNEMNDVLLNEKRQDLAYMQHKAQAFERLEATMATDSGNDLDMSISNLLDNFSELATDPQDKSVRSSLLSKAQQLTIKFGDISNNIDRNSELIQGSANQTVNSINLILQDVHSLNTSISQAQAAGNPDNASLDLRVRKLEELSELIDFDTQPTNNGEVEIRIGGVKVLDANKADQLRAEINDVDKTFMLRIGSGKLVKTTGGQLGAEIEMYQKEIPDLKSRLDSLAETMVKEFNALHAQGFGLEDATQRNFFDPSGTTAADIKVNAAILNNPNHIAASDAVEEDGNGNMAASIAELRNKHVAEGRKLVDYSIDLISTPGIKLSSLNSQIEARDSEINMLTTQQERESGVNIDEELSLMIQYQNAYRGSAQVMAAAQQMYDILLGIMR